MESARVRRGKKKLLSLQPEGGPPREEIGEGEEKAKRGVVEWRLSLPRFFLPRSLLKKLLLGTGRGEIEKDDLPFSSYYLMAKHFPSDLVTISVRFQFWHEDAMPILKSIQLCASLRKKESHYCCLCSILVCLLFLQLMFNVS